VSAIAVTFDVDWAPDWAVRECLDLCRRFSRPATFFITHWTDMLAEFAAAGGVEIGIHPNFLPGSTHGGDVRAVLDYCCALAPGARSMRSHSLMQSSPIFVTVTNHYPSIRIDASLFLAFHPNLRATRLYFERHRYITRVPSLWADDIAASWPGWTWQVGPMLEAPGLKVFNFHPAHVCLNLRDLSAYRALKAAMDMRPMWSASRGDFAPHLADGIGCRVFLESLLASDGEFKRIEELETADGV
jgi:hypothetical protein